MALREWELWLRNDTPFKLLLNHTNIDHGVWSDGGSPPDVIEPYNPKANNWGYWHTESNGWLRGTEGEIWWYIDDTNEDVLLGSDGHKGYGDCLYVHWSNPYVWGPSTVPLATDLRDCHGPERLKEQTGLSPDYALFGASGFHAIDNPDAGEVWTQAFSGAVFGAPLLGFFGHRGEHQRIWLSLRLRSIVNSASALLKKALEDGLIPAEPLPDRTVKSMRPLTGTAPADWSGRWANMRQGKAAITVNLEASMAPNSVLVSVDESIDGVTVPSTQAAIAETQAPFFEGDNWGSDAVATAMRPGDMVLRPEIPKSVGGKSSPDMVLVAAEKPRMSGVDRQYAQSVDEVSVVDEQAIILQLYGGYDGKHALVEHRLRYTRLDTTGALRFDVMLYPANPIK